MLCNAVGGGGGGFSFPRKKALRRLQFNVISITRGWVGVKFQGKNCYVTLELPLMEYFNVVLLYVHTNSQTTLVIETT